MSGLIGSGAPPDVNVVSASLQAVGAKLLYLAAFLGHEEAARSLDEAGAEVHFYCPVHESDVFTQQFRVGVKSW